VAITTKQNRTGTTFILLAVLCAVIAGVLVFFACLKIAPSVPVLVAVDEIQAGDPLKPEMFKVVKLAKAGLPDGIINPGADLSTFMAKYGMAEGDLLRKSGVIDNEDFTASLLSARLSVQNDPSLRAVEVPVEAAASMLAGIKAGDRIDVVSVIVSDEEDGQQHIAETIIEDAKVIGVNTPGESSNGALVIAISPDQAETFFLARVKGKVFATLRPFGIGKGE